MRIASQRTIYSHSASEEESEASNARINAATDAKGFEHREEQRRYIIKRKKKLER